VAKKNEFASVYVDCISKLTLLNFQSFRIDHQKQNEENLAGKLLDKLKAGMAGRKDFDHRIAGAALMSLDPYTTRPNSSELPYHIVYGTRNVTKSRLVRAIQETSRRMQGHILCMSFETMETFLKEIGSVFYWQMRNKLTVNRRQEFHKTHRKRREHTFVLSRVRLLVVPTELR
jgi:hypothetical protein